MFRQVARVTVQSAERRTEVVLDPPPKIDARPISPPRADFRRDYLSPLSSSYLDRSISAADFRAEAVIVQFRTGDVFANLAAASPSAPGVLAFRTRAAIFGHNAPRWVVAARQPAIR